MTQGDRVFWIRLLAMHAALLSDKPTSLTMPELADKFMMQIDRYINPPQATAAPPAKTVRTADGREYPVVNGRIQR